MRIGKWVWMDGKLVPTAKAQVHVLSHALHYGSGVFEGIRAYETPRGPAIFRLNDHIDRFFHSAGALGMKIPYSKLTIARAIQQTIKKNGLRACYVRPLAFYGEGQMALMPNGARLRVAIAAWPWGAYLGEHAGLSLGVSPYIRFHPRSIIPGAKISGYYATSVLATIDARRRGFNEALLLDHENLVAEGPGENIFIVKNGMLSTPRSLSILPGLTRASIIQIAKDLRIPVAEKRMTLRELVNADEIFLTGTATEVAPVLRVNKKRIRKAITGPMTAKLRAAYIAAVSGRSTRYRRWLTAV